MTLKQLRYVLMVAEKGSISVASKALFISQPSLTNAIKELEEELHINIFTRTNKGVIVSNEGDTFLGYARQVIEQANLLEDRYTKGKGAKHHFSVSTQHYSFAVNAFVDVIREYDFDKYEFTLRETQTHEILEDVSKLKSEIGVLYLSEFNQVVLKKLMNEYDLMFTELFVAKPHVFISNKHPLVEKDIISLDDLQEYPYLSFEQGEYNSFYFSEEILSTVDRKKNIKVRDRATLFNLVIGLNGYTVSTGVLDAELNGTDIVSRPLNHEADISVGIIRHKNSLPTHFGISYTKALQNHIHQEFGHS